jgi:hypothetical protein
MDISGKDKGPFDDKDKFMQLFVPKSEMVEQSDVSSCGIFICLHILQFICSQSGCPYILSDMEKQSSGQDEGQTKYFVPASYNFMKLLQPVEWASMDGEQQEEHSLQLTTRF